MYESNPKNPTEKMKLYDIYSGLSDAAGSGENSPAPGDIPEDEPIEDAIEAAEKWFSQLFRPGRRILFDLYQTEINSINRGKTIADKLYGLVQCIEIFHSDAHAVSELRFDMDWLNDVVKPQAQQLLDDLPESPSKKTERYWMQCNQGLRKLEALIIINLDMEEGKYPTYGDFQEFYEKDIKFALRALIKKQI